MTRAIDLVELVRVHIHRSITLIGERQPLRTAGVALSERIIGILGQTTEPDGWVTRSRLLSALGRPETASFNDCLEPLVEHGLLESRIVPGAGSGRPATAYRIRK